MDARTLNDLVGKPFFDGGRGPGAFDCWGLTMQAMRLYGYELPECPISAFDSVLIDIEITIQKRQWKELPAPVAGCVAVMRFGCSDYVNHVATCIGDGLMLHTREKTGSVVERIDKPVFKSLIQGFYLPPEEYKI